MLELELRGTEFVLIQKNSSKGVISAHLYSNTVRKIQKDTKRKGKVLPSLGELPKELSAMMMIRKRENLQTHN